MPVSRAPFATATRATTPKELGWHPSGDPDHLEERAGGLGEPVGGDGMQKPTRNPMKGPNARSA